MLQGVVGHRDRQHRAGDPQARAQAEHRADQAEDHPWPAGAFPPREDAQGDRRERNRHRGFQAGAVPVLGRAERRQRRRPDVVPQVHVAREEPRRPALVGRGQHQAQGVGRVVARVLAERDEQRRIAHHVDEGEQQRGADDERQRAGDQHAPQARPAFLDRRRQPRLHADERDAERGEDELVAVLEQRAQQRDAGDGEPGAAAPGIERAEAGQQGQRQHADEELLEVAGERDEMHRPQQEERAGHEGRSAGQPDAARQRVQAPPRQRDAEERGPVERRRGAPRPERQRQDAVQRSDAVDEHRDAVRPQQVGRLRPADAAGQCLRRVPEDPDGVALVVVDVADGVGREVTRERPARRDREHEIRQRDDGAGQRRSRGERTRPHRTDHTVTRSSTWTGASPANASRISRSASGGAGGPGGFPSRACSRRPPRKMSGRRCTTT